MILTNDELCVCFPMQGRCPPAELGGGVRKGQWCWRQGEALLIGEGGRLTAVLNVEGICFCVPVKGRYLLADLGGGEIRLCGWPLGRSSLLCVCGGGNYHGVLLRDRLDYPQ